MKGQTWRYVRAVLDGFNGISALAGGILILLGVDRFPLSWLERTPFHDYTVPSLLLAGGVGVVGLAAMGTEIIGDRRAPLVSLISGATMVAWIGLELAFINAPKPSTVELLYLGSGLALLAISALSVGAKARSF